MTRLTRSIFLFMAFYVAIALQFAHAQNVLDPNDPVVTYDPNNPPVQPPDGQIGKWVRTVRMTWNTDMYKAYIYKGLAFRLHFPKTYNPTANDGKKYPIMLFFHGHGEYGPITDNEFHLLHGHQGFDQAIQQGIYDGYVLSAQSTDFFNITDYDRLIQIVNYMIANNKVDPFHITVNGLSQGGQACWEMLSTFPTYISASSPMSWSQTSYTDPTFINKIKYTPNWVFQGTEDTNPYPSITYSVRDAMVAAGANFRLTVYQGVGHGTWWNAWGEPDFWPFNNRAYSSNPWQIGGTKSYWPGAAINATLGLPAGFAAYEWRKDGVLISGATSNTITATSGGVYSARVQRNGMWSEWSPVPVSILPGHYEAEDYTSMFGVQTETTTDAGGGKDVGWIELGDYMDYDINAGSTGTVTLKLRVATPNNGAQLKIKKADGTVLATVNIPNSGGWQTWQTISTPINISSGQQTLRIESSSTAGWNINWFEFSLGSSGNVPPTVNAGSSQTITLPTNSVTLTGTASDPDGSIASYSWTKVTGGAATITSPSSASTTVTGLVQGSYNFRLTVTDNLGASSSSDVTVTVNGNNQPPTVNAGSDQTITLPTNSVSLSGTASDADGSVASYAWSKTAGGAATITSPSSNSTTVTGLVQGTYTFRLSVTDNQGAVSTDDVNVIVNPQPAPGSGTRIEAENWTAMSGVLTEACADAGGTLDVGWIDNGDWMDYTVNVPTAGSYTLNLRIATPNTGAQFLIKNSTGTILTTVNVPTTGGWQVWQTITTNINLVAGTQTIRLQANSAAGWNINWMELVGAAPANQPPTANAGADQTITLPASSVTLSGSGTDPDGSITTYSWTKVSGGAATITAPASASTTVTGLTQGTYTFRLAVTDNSGATATDDVVITVNAAANQAPTANAGLDQTITQPQSSVSLSGSGTDPDGSIASYSWTKVSGVGGTITSPSSAATTVTGLSAGTYVFRLTVTDNSGATASDDVNVVVNSATNQLPTASAGLDQTITLPATLTLSGSGTDPDGTIASYSWTKVSGGSATITSPSAASTTVTGLAAGTYTFRLTVTDNGGATAFDEVNVTVNAAPANQLPIANAGADQSIILPVSSVTLSGSGTDPDGSIASYSWTKVSGTGGTITSPASASTTVTGLTAGSYTFRLTVTDNSGASASDDVVITVNQQPTPTYSKKIEAESYTSTVGTVTTAATTDAGGGQQVGGLDNNDALNYTVDVPYSGTYTVNFRVGATKGGSKLQLLSSSGTLLATINVPNTGTAWQTVSVQVNLTAGIQTFKVIVNKSSGNPVFNWWEINLSSLSGARAAANTRSEVRDISAPERLQLYPMPAKDQLVLELTHSFTGTFHAQVLNFAGAVQKEYNFGRSSGTSRHIIPISSLPKGEYILSVQINGTRESRKFIKI